MSVESFLDRHFIGNGDGRIDGAEAFEYLWLIVMIGLLIGQLRAARRGNTQSNSKDINRKE